MPGRSSSAESPRRGRGTRAGLSRDAILAVARRMDPRDLTMQAVADELGVDRKALNYHVRDRDSLLELLAIDAMLARFAAIEVDPDGDWREASRAWATGMRDSVLATGALVSYFPFRGPAELSMVGPAEVVLEKLLAAGFDIETAARGMHLLNTISIGFARDLVDSSREGGHPQVAELRRALRESPTGFDALRRVFDVELDTYDERQFDFELSAYFARMETLLPKEAPDG